MRRLLVATVGAAVLATTSCSGGDPQAADPTLPSDTATSSPSTIPPLATPPPRPLRLTCRRISYQAAIAPTSSGRAVPCRGGHTAQTYAVGRLRTVVHGHLLAIHSARVQRQPAAICPSRLAAFLGTAPDRLRLSLLRAVWFTPTAEQAAAGADWYRCDVIAVGEDGRLARLRGSLDHALGKPAARDVFAMCATAQPGTKGFQRVLCRSPHTWRAITVVPLTAGKHGRYPGVAAVRAAGQDPCQTAGRAVAANSLDYQWGYEWPTRAQWRAGQTYGRCWAPDPA